MLKLFVRHLSAEKQRKKTKALDPVSLLTKTLQDEMLSIVSKHGTMKFLAHYHRQAGLPLPSSLGHVMVVGKNTTHRINTPAHTVNNRQVSASTLVVTCNKKIENAATVIIKQYCASLLKNVDEAFVSQYAITMRSNVRLLGDQLEEPLLVNISPQSIAAMKNTPMITHSPPQIHTPNQHEVDKSRYVNRYIEAYKQHALPTSYVNILPIHALYSTILETIHSNQVTIISAETGAGKTTQVRIPISTNIKIPQFLLSACEHNGTSPPSIVITQPRKIAATSVAERVASERNEVLGQDSAVGYSVRFDEQSPINNTYGTAGKFYY